jgi:hypothetical protein
MMIRRLLPAFLGLSALASVTPAAADCQMAGPVAEVLGTAAVAFVGEVTTVSGSVAIVAVREVWAGNVADVVEVRGLGDRSVLGTQEGPSEDDRSWEAGTTYLMLPYVDGSILRDHICSATTVWTDDLAILRPADARLMTAETAPPGGPPLVVVVIALGALSVLIISGLAFRRRRV